MVGQIVLEYNIDMKKLYKSKENKVISGVFGGIGEYYEVDPTVLRLGYIAIVALSGFMPGVVAYVIASLVVPEKK